MKLKNLFHLMVLGCTLTMTAVGCRHKPPPVTTLPDSSGASTKSNPKDLNAQPGIPANSGDVTGRTPSGISVTDPSKYDNYDAHPDILQAQTIHFEYDKSAVRATDEPKLEEVAKYMKDNPTHAVRVEGNCDERGTEEYNRSLGERRALAARESLAKLGIDPGRVVTISYGQDRPVEPLHNNDAWSKNRRDDFVVLTPPKQ
jgi:peptidoglycan-associated lipoprotein